MGDSTRKVLVIARREFLERVRSRWFVIVTLFGPILFAAIGFAPVFLARHAERASPRLIVIDATGTALGRYVALSFGAPRDVAGADSATPPAVADLRAVQPAALPTAERAATSEVQQRLASGYVVLDSATLRGGAVHYAGRRADSPSERARIAGAVRAARVALAVGGAGIPGHVLDSLAALPPPTLQTESITDAGRGAANGAKALLAAFVAFFLYAAIILYGQAMLSSVIEEKLSRVSEVIVSSVRPELLLAGKLLGVTAVGITQIAVWIGGSALLLGARGALFGAPASAARGAPGAAAGGFLDAVLATSWGWVLVVVLFFLLGFLFYGALYAAVGATVGSESEARQAAQPVILLLVFTAVFISPVTADPASTLARVLSLLPFSAPILMPLRMALYDVPAWEVAASIALLVVGVVGALWLAARIYRVGLLMYGKRPTMRELRRWIVAG